MVLQLADSEQLTRLNAENSYRQFIAINSLIKANQAEYDAAIIFRDGVSKEVEFGLKTLLDLLDAEQDVVNAELNLISTRGDYVLSGYTMLASMGQLNAETFGLSPVFISVDDLPEYELPFSGIPPQITYQD
jgi:outer membrane protein